jgi:hypothetical protein
MLRDGQRRAGGHGSLHDAKSVAQILLKTVQPHDRHLNML